MKKMNDALIERVVVFLQGLDKVNVALLQRQFRLTYPTAASMMDELIQRKLIRAKRDEAGKHEVIKSKRLEGTP